MPSAGRARQSISVVKGEAFHDRLRQQYPIGGNVGEDFLEQLSRTCDTQFSARASRQSSAREPKSKQGTPRPKRNEIEIEPLNLDETLRHLLAEQRIAVETVLSCNQIIAEQLVLARCASLREREVGQDMEAGKPPSGRNQGRRPSKDLCQDEISYGLGRRPSKDLSLDGMLPTLSEPLLGGYASNEDDDDDDESDNPSPPGEPITVDRRKKFRRASTIQMSLPSAQFHKTVSDTLNQPSYHVEDCYKEHGFWSWVAKHPLFNNAILLIILMNTIWIAIDTDYNQADILADADWEFQLMDNFFCTVFSFEMLVRFLAFERKRYALTDPWFLFDGLLVALMIWETWISMLLSMFGLTPSGSGKAAASVLRVFRIFRLFRVARTARLLSSVPELMILAKGMFIAMRSVLVILCLLFLIIYIFAIIFTQLLKGADIDKTSRKHFRTVPESANFLLLQVFCGLDYDFSDSLWHEDLICYGLFLLYNLLGSLTIMNMLIGILCDVVFRVAEDEKEDTFQSEMQHKVEGLAASLDYQGRGYVEKVDFETIITEPDVILSLSDLGVDVIGLMDFAHFVFQENEHLSHDNFLHMVLQFRNGKSATVKDVMHLRKQMSMQVAQVLEDCEEIKALHMGLHDQVDKLKALNFGSAVVTVPQIIDTQKSVVESAGKDVGRTEEKQEKTVQRSVSLQSPQSNGAGIGMSPPCSPPAPSPPSSPPSSPGPTPPETSPRISSAVSQAFPPCSVALPPSALPSMQTPC